LAALRLRLCLCLVFCYFPFVLSPVIFSCSRFLVWFAVCVHVPHAPCSTSPQSKAIIAIIIIIISFKFSQRKKRLCTPLRSFGCAFFLFFSLFSRSSSFGRFHLNNLVCQIHSFSSVFRRPSGRGFLWLLHDDWTSRSLEFFLFLSQDVQCLIPALPYNWCSLQQRDQKEQSARYSYEVRGAAQELNIGRKNSTTSTTCAQTTGPVASSCKSQRKEPGLRPEAAKNT